MKKNLFFTMYLAVCSLLFSMTAIAAPGDNLLLNGDMDTKGAWAELKITDAQPTVTWGYTDDKPTAGTGNVLRIYVPETTAQVQYAVYQKVNLEAGKSYEIDGAFKAIGNKMTNGWAEIYISTTEPVDGTDYSTGVTTKFGQWNNPKKWDGTFKEDATGDKTFTPTGSGEYYFLIKAGCNSGTGFDLLLDDMSLKEQVLPVASFSANVRVGAAPLTVAFTSTSLRAVSYSWDFGDDSPVSTEANPTHTYNNAGKYTVSLTVVNEYGNNVSTQTDYINVQEFTQITGGGKLGDGNMENEASWSTTVLDSPANPPLTTTWNYTEAGKNPTAGQGGALRIAIENATANVQFGIYQKVSLKADRVYRFNGAFKDNSANLWHFWSEVYIAPDGDEPQDGADFGAATGRTLIASIGNWETATSPNRGLDGTYKLHAANYKEFIPEADGDYYFVFKVGVGGGSNSCDVVIDELLLEEVLPKPYANFTAENNIGFSPLEVSFSNTTKFAESYEWDFGDGSAKSAEANPRHTYGAIGAYTVSLKAVNATGDSTIVKTDFVSVNPREELPNGEKLYGGNMENGGFWHVTQIGGADIATVTWDYQDDLPTGGEGGALRVQIPAHTTGSVNLTFWQAIELKEGYQYVFDGLFKDRGEGDDHFWAQIFMSPEAPVENGGDGAYLVDVNTLGMFHTWSNPVSVGYDGTFSGGAIIGNDHKSAGGELLTYHRTGVDTTYYFVCKIGTSDGSLDALLDNFTLKESLWVPKPKASFVAEQPTTSETAPLTVQFWDESENAETWLWNFGDGTTSTEQDPEHTYTSLGWYTVSLTVTSGSLSDTYTLENAIQVGPEPTAIAEIVAGEYVLRSAGNRIEVTNGQSIHSIVIYNVGGNLVESARLQSGYYISGTLPQGIYIVKVDGNAHKVLVRP
jgi:PKD repeat protein